MAGVGVPLTTLKPIRPEKSLHHAVQKDDSELFDEWMEYLIRCRDWENSDTYSAEVKAMTREERDELLTAKEEIDKKDANGFCPVHHAAIFGREHMLRKLKENNADLHKKSDEGYSPIDYVVLRYSKGGSQASTDDTDGGGRSVETDGNASPNMIEFLINCIDDLSSDKAPSPLHLACKVGNTSAVECIMKKLSEEKRTAILQCKRNGNTPIHEVCLSKSLATFEELIKHEIEGNIYDLFCKTNDEGRNPLHILCQDDSYDIIRSMMLKLQETDHENLADTCDTKNNRPLHLLCEGSISDSTVMKEQIPSSLVKYMMENLDAENSDKETPLHVASRHSGSMVSFLLKEGKRKAANSVNKFSSKNQTPLMIAASENNDSACYDLVLHEETELDATGEKKRYPHHMAAQRGHIEALKALQGVGRGMTLSEDAEKTLKKSELLLDKSDEDYNKPLHLAAEGGHIECVRFLLSYTTKESLEYLNSDGNTPFHLAAKNGRNELVHYFVEHGQDNVLKNKKNNTALHLACMSGYFQTVQEILKRSDIDLNVRNKDKRTPLDEAVSNAHFEIAKLLVEKGAKVNPDGDNDGSIESSLQLAVDIGHLEMVEFLLDKEADVNWGVSKQNTTPIIKAIENGHESIAMAIVNSTKWPQDSLKEITSDTSTPFRKLIEKMPDVARRVLDRCTTKIGESKRQFDFQYMDDLDMNRVKKFFMGCFNKCRDTCSKCCDTYCCCKCECGNMNQQEPEHLQYKKDNHPLYIMVKHKRKDLLAHPLVTALLNKKWVNFGLPFFIISFLLYGSLFLAFITLLAVQSPNPRSETCKKISENKFGRMNDESIQFLFNQSDCVNFSGNNTMNNIDPDLLSADGINLSGKQVCANESVRCMCGLSKEDCGICGQSIYQINVVRTTAAFVFVVACLQLLFEGYQFFTLPKQYLLDIVNFVVDIPLFLCAMIFSFVFVNECLCPLNCQWQIGVIAVFLAWIDLVSYIRVLPFGIYFLMFQKIFVTFWKVIVLTLVLVIAFGLAFYMSFDDLHPSFERSPFRNPFRSLVKVMSMTSGDLTYDSVFRLFPEGGTHESGEEIPFIEVSYIIWILFLIVMPILFSNFLTGLAIDDIQEIRNDAEVTSLELKIDFILIAEAVLPISFCCWKNNEFVVSRNYKYWWIKKLDKIKDFIVGILPIYAKEKKDTFKEVKQVKHNMQLIRTQMDDFTQEVLEEISKHKKDTIDQIEKTKTDIDEVQRKTLDHTGAIQKELITIKEEQLNLERRLIECIDDRIGDIQVSTLNLERLVRQLMPKT